VTVSRLRKLIVPVLCAVPAVVAANAVAASGAALNVTGTWQAEFDCTAGPCTSTSEADTLMLTQAQGSDVVTGTDSTGATISGMLVTGSTFSVTGTGKKGFVVHATVTVAANGLSWSGTYTDSKGTSGTDTATRQPPPAPANTALPTITGSTTAGAPLTCSEGSWSNAPDGFTYEWFRDGTPIIGTTGATYTVLATDEGLTLTCTVTASNLGGAASATSAGVPVPVLHVAHCPAASGALSGNTLGVLRLGMTRAQAVHAFAHSSTRGKSYQVFFCLTPRGVRVGIASPKLVKTLPKSERALAGHVIWASTSSFYYSVHGVRCGGTVAAAGKVLKLTGPFHIGKNFWYLAPNGASTAVFKVRAGVIEEIGIADKQLTKGHKAQVAFLTSFS
jgi:hypothetical protein